MCPSGTVQRGGCPLRPYSALYYLNKNRRRAIAVICVFAFVFLAYLGAVYISPSMDISLRAVEAQADFCIVEFDDATQDATTVSKVRALLRENPNVARAIPCNPYRGLNYRTNMGMRMSTRILTLSSPEDFEVLNETLGLSVATPQDKEIIMSDLLLQNLGYRVGDMLPADGEAAVNFYSGDVRIAGTFRSDAFVAYVVDEADNMSAILVTRQVGAAEASGGQQDMGRADFYDTMRAFEDANAGISVLIPDENLDSYNEMFGTFRMVYGLVDLIIAGVLSLTAVATVSGMYEKRNYEFSVYKAIGFSRKEIFGKIASEILLLDAAAVLVGAGLVIVSIFLLNRFAFSGIGMPIPYVHPFGVAITIVANAMVVIPALLYRLVRVNKLDICEY